MADHPLIEQVKSFPALPGVYLMKDDKGRILYVGKAKSLKARVRSYFQSIEKLTAKTQVLIKKIVAIEFTVTPTELEALLLECNLIKKHRPRYNIRLKDDKNYPFVALDFTHPFPQFRITRKVVPSASVKYFGPYSGGAQEIGRFLLKTFQIRDCSDSKFSNRTRPCLNYEIGTCTAPCVALVTQENYSKQIQEATQFLKGKHRHLLSSLKKEMTEASDRMDYEVAKQVRDKIFALEKISEKQGAIIPGFTKTIDIIASFQTEDEIQWVVLFLRSGVLTGRRSQKTSVSISSQEDAQRTFLEQFYTESLIPDEIWLQNDFEDRELLEKFLSERNHQPMRIRVPKNEIGLRLLGMAFENARLLFLEKQKEAKSASETLQEALGLKEIPHSIEGMDVSNLQGTSPVISLVHFSDEKPLKSRYRMFYPRTIEGQNDFGMIYEACLRRFQNKQLPPPDLLLIDGGKGQLQSAMKALEELKMEVPLCSLAKARTESSFTLSQIERSEERIFIPHRKNPILLKENNPALRLLMQVRDESHRFALKNHRRRRKKTDFEK